MYGLGFVVGDCVDGYCVCGVVVFIVCYDIGGLFSLV